MLSLNRNLLYFLIFNFIWLINYQFIYLLCLVQINLKYIFIKKKGISILYYNY